MNSTINPERLAALDQLTLHGGSHSSFDDGHCAMEVVSWLADEGFTDAPACASPVLARYTIALNDRWDDQKRQLLKPFLPRMVGTGGDGKDALREQIAAQYVAERLLGPWLRLAGLDEHADALAAAGDVAAIRTALWAARDAAWELRRERIAVIKAKVLERLREKPAAAVADAVAAAVAVADAAAVAVAAAAAAAAAVAAADAAAAAVAAAAADAAAVAAAVADAAAVAAAAADAAAAAVADAAAAADAAADAAAAAAAAASYSSRWSAAYNAARAYYREHPLPITQQVADLAAEQEPFALELLELMIDPAVA